MAEPSIRKLVQTASLTQKIPALEWLSRGLFRAQGYDWETRTSGDMKLGLWRKSFSSRSQKSPYPKRFILIPGFGDSPLSWYPVVMLLTPLLKKNYDEVVLLDFPSFSGVLSKEKSFPSMDLMFTAVNDSLDSLKPHTLVGHSLGGWLSAHYTALCGKKLRPKSNPQTYGGPESIYLFCPSGIFPNETSLSEFEGIFRRSMQEGFHTFKPYLFFQEPLWFRWVMPFLQDFHSREDVVQFMLSIQQEHRLDDLADGLDANTWLIWGDQDRLIPHSTIPAWTRFLSQKKNYNRPVILKNIGHSPQLEAPGRTALLLAQMILGRTPHPMGKRWWTEHEEPTSKDPSTEFKPSGTVA
ncbi:MAG: alpha/beta fold hydrolase [Bdellovibrionia bacterium]